MYAQEIWSDLLLLLLLFIPGLSILQALLRSSSPLFCRSRQQIQTGTTAGGCCCSAQQMVALRQAGSWTLRTSDVP
jgi:hypothetical protein